MKTNPNEPIGFHKFEVNDCVIDQGLTKREYFAAMAMQNMVSKVGIDSVDFHWVDQSKANISKAAVVLADALIKALNEAQGD